LHPILEQVIDDFDGRFPIYEVDVGVSPGIAQKYGVISVPQILFFVDGKNVERIVGMVVKDKIVKKVNAHLE